MVRGSLYGTSRERTPRQDPGLLRCPSRRSSIVNAIRWEDVRKDFAPDGALRDIYVENVSSADWERVLSFVVSEYGPPRFLVDGEPAPLPRTAQDVFELHGRCSTIMNFDVGGMDIACHFFGEDEIEFDLLPAEVDGPTRLTALLGFLRRLALLTSKPVLHTHENSKDAAFVRVTAEGDAQMVPLRGG